MSISNIEYYHLVGRIKSLITLKYITIIHNNILYSILSAQRFPRRTRGVHAAGLQSDRFSIQTIREKVFVASGTARRKVFLSVIPWHLWVVHAQECLIIEFITIVLRSFSFEKNLNSQMTNFGIVEIRSKRS